jgi:hypothetical protein
MEFPAAAGIVPVAVLVSPAGHLYFYEAAAITTVINSLSLTCSPAAPKLLDGFTLEQWAAFGKRKSAIASRVCKENGALKAKLASSGGDSDDGEPSIRRLGTETSNMAPVDPLQANDPWFGCSAPRVSCDVVNASSSGSSWSAWCPTQRRLTSGSHAEWKEGLKANCAQDKKQSEEGGTGSDCMHEEANTPSDDGANETAYTQHNALSDEGTDKTGTDEAATTQSNTLPDEGAEAAYTQPNTRPTVMRRWGKGRCTDETPNTLPSTRHDEGTDETDETANGQPNTPSDEGTDETANTQPHTPPDEGTEVADNAQLQPNTPSDEGNDETANEQPNDEAPNAQPNTRSDKDNYRHRSPCKKAYSLTMWVLKDSSSDKANDTKTRGQETSDTKDRGHGKATLCWNFKGGNCTFGERCHFAHSESELVPREAQGKSQNSWGKGGGNALRWRPKDDEEGGGKDNDRQSFLPVSSASQWTYERAKLHVGDVLGRRRAQ